MSKERSNFGIEYVCTANGSRSPIAETLGKDYVRQLGLENRIKVYSSGSRAETIRNNVFSSSTEFLLDIIEKSLGNAIYREKAEHMAREIMAKRQKSALAVEQGNKRTREMIEYCIRYSQSSGTANRYAAILEIGLIPKTSVYQQTEVRDDVDLILPMKKRNVKHVKEIYKSSEQNPLIVPICEYAETTEEIIDPYGGSLKDYKQTRDMIMQIVRRTINKAIKEHFIG